MLLKRSPEETCHGCHKTDQNAPSDPNSLKTHNSINAGSSKWSSAEGWGIAGGKYGKFGCTTCHTAHATTNIYLLKEIMATPDGSNWVSSGTPKVNVLFKKKSLADSPSPGVSDGVMGDDSDAPRSSSTRICQVCHSQTNKHSYAISADAGHENANDCTTCHSHRNAFSHAGGGGTGCESCHGHDAGYEYSPGQFSQGRGTTQSHATHTEQDANHLRGPGTALLCGDCHNTSNFPYFKSGTDSNGDGKYSLSETDVCNTCHSYGGTYDGVNDAIIGAKNNWKQGIYSGSVLKSGKEKWCSGCHDEGVSIINGVSAPNVIGKESEAFTYGAGWGYYKTGHGLPADQKYPASGGVTAGAGVECSSCHDNSAAHIDGLARTFDDQESDSLDPSSYRQGYRLKMVAPGEGTGVTGREPMLVPYPGTTVNSANNYRLCVTCHASGPFVDSNDTNTNLKTNGINRHEYHLRSISIGKRVSSDWSNTACTSGDSSQCNSRITCTTCHNVHGSTRLAMVNDGKLVGREPGLKYWYYNSDIVSFTSPPDTQPTPTNLPLTASTGTVWSAGSSSNLCSHCHGNTWLVTEARTPFQDVAQAPTLSWAGTAGYEADGVDPDTAGGGSNFTFRVKYNDGNNDAPTEYQIWIDKNDNGAYEVDEKVDMTALDPADANYFDGKIYTFTTPLYKQGDNTLNYRFYFKSGTDVATGAPASDHQVTVTNSVPTLSWTGETNYVSDGVHPDTGGNGSSFTFRVKYTDNDNEAPDTDGVRVVINGASYTLDPEAGGSYSTGKIYSRAIALSTVGDVNYHFIAKDPAGVSATGDPTADHVVTVLASSNNPPVLSWTSANCLTEGVRPRTGAKSGDFEFRVIFSDMDNQCPTYIRVTVNGATYDLTGDDGASCQTGRTYYHTIMLATSGDLNYSFSASDGADAATGTPTSDHVVSVVNTAYKVRPAGGSGWYTDVATAYNATPASETLLVYPNADFSTATYTGGLYNINKTNRTLQSVCGADLTIISGGGTQVIYLYGNDGTVIDGFTLTGGTSYGIYSNSDSMTVKNSKIHSNPVGILLNNGCNPVSIQNTSIYGNTSYGIYSQSNLNVVSISNSNIYNNSGGTGGGINFNGGTGHTISGSSLTGNTASTNGGAIYCNACTMTIDDSTFNGNSAGAGGAIYLLNAATATISDTFIQGNQAANAGAIYIANPAGSANLTNVMLTGNKATTGNGGAMVVNGASTLLFTTVSGNYAGNLAGAIYHNSTGTTTIKNSIISNNDALNQPNYKQIYAVSGRWQYVDVYNTLINQAPGSSSSATYSYEDLGGNNTAGSPNFVNGQAPASAPTTAGDYHLLSGSPAINAASASWTSDHDIFDRTPGSRPKGGAYDMGAHEKE